MTEEIEIWKTIQTANKYEISTLGRIKTIRTGRIRKQKMTYKGYLECNLVTDNSPTTMRVHRLVGFAFVDGYSELQNQIDHIDEVKNNNHYTNLRWVSNKENKHYQCKNKYGKDWIPKIHPTREEIDLRKLKQIKLKQEKLENMTYGSREEMIKQIANPVLVNNIQYQSSREAAKFICEDNEIIATMATVRKEIQRMIQGKRKPWTYKEKYKIEPVL